jgi:CBS domain containing-hemolysin-like protein
MPDIENAAGDAESSSGPWSKLGPAIRKFFRLGDGDRSLRAQLEDAIDEHEEDSGDTPTPVSTDGDLSSLERQMLRNMLHFSEHDADDIAVPRSEIIAVDASTTGRRLQR